MKMNWIPDEHPEWLASGKLVTCDMEMVPYEDHRMRTIRVWTPDSYDGVKRFPVIYMHDGQGVFEDESKPDDMLHMDRILTELAKEGIEAIVVAIDTSRMRLQELTPPGPRAEIKVDPNNPRSRVDPGPSTTDTYMAFVIDTLKPIIDADFTTLPDAKNTVIGGGSAAGSASLYMSLQRPDVFGKGIVLSPGLPRFTLEGLLNIVDDYDLQRIKDSRIAFYNGDQGLDATSFLYVSAVYRRFKERGVDRSQMMALFDTRESHTSLAWNRYLPEILRFLFIEDNTRKL